MTAHNRVLLVDDDPTVLRAHEKLLHHQGWCVESAENGRVAIERLRSAHFDVIVSDVSMPVMGGLDFLRTVRSLDIDVPVVLMTGDPGVESAIRAIDYGVFRYLVKPVDGAVLDETLCRATRLHALARLKREALLSVDVDEHELADRADLAAHFDAALSTLWMAYQPIVSLRRQRVFAYEALLRCEEPTMRNPDAILDAAERLGRVHELGRCIRARVASQSVLAPEGVKLFVNLHPRDLTDPELYAPDAPLTQIARRVVLEITERTSLDQIKDVAACVHRLRTYGFEIAIDDLGAGYAGLTSYAVLDPSIVKFDMSLVRDIDSSSRRKKIVGSMKRLCDELHTTVVAEGVETVDERDALTALGCDLLQGYLFGRPAAWSADIAVASDLKELVSR